MVKEEEYFCLSVRQDVNAVAVEETKLAALEDISAHFQEVTGV